MESTREETPCEVLAGQDRMSVHRPPVDVGEVDEGRLVQAGATGTGQAKRAKDGTS